jgi:hypothetical protein
MYPLARYSGDLHNWWSLLYSNPPLSNQKVLQKDQPPPRLVLLRFLGR